MSCTSCNSGGYTTYSATPAKVLITSAGGSEIYSIEQLEAWRALLLCIKEKDYISLGITTVQINAALGIVYSSINHQRNMRYFEPYLNKHQALILIIINSGQCP